MLCSWRLFPELGASVAGQSVILFLDQIVFLKDAQLRSYLDWVGGWWSICRFLRQHWGYDMLEACTEGRSINLGHCSRWNFLFPSRVGRWTSFRPLGMQLEFFWRHFSDRRWKILPRPFLFRNLWCGCFWYSGQGILLFCFDQSVWFPFCLVCEFLNFRHRFVDIRDILIFHPHLGDNPARIVVPCETHDRSAHPAPRLLHMKEPICPLILSCCFFFRDTKWISSKFIICLMYSKAKIMTGRYLGSLYGAKFHPYTLISVWFWYKYQSPVLVWSERCRILWTSSLILGSSLPLSILTVGW